MGVSRRDFLAGLGSTTLLGACGLDQSEPGIDSSEQSGCRSNSFRIPQTVTFSMITDLHYELYPPALSHLETFLTRASELEPGFIIQLGDFSHGGDDTTVFSLWNEYEGARYHVCGNHDTENSPASDKGPIRDRFGIERLYYSFDQGPFRFLVLDRNFGRNGDCEIISLPAILPDLWYIDELQREWLIGELASADRPCVLFYHQPVGLAHSGSDLILAEIIRNAKTDSGIPKVIACFAGHEHGDRLTVIDEIPHMTLNSASYRWAGASGGMVGYDAALFADVTLSTKGTILIQGTQAGWVEPTPQDREIPGADEWEEPRVASRGLSFPIDPSWCEIFDSHERVVFE